MKKNNTNVGYDPKIKLMNQHGLSYEQAELQQVVKYTGFEDITPPDMHIKVMNTDEEWDTLNQIHTIGVWIQKLVVSTCDKYYFRCKKRGPGVNKVIKMMNTNRQFKRVAPTMSLTLYKDTIQYAIFNWMMYNKKEITKAELMKRCDCLIWWTKKTDVLDINSFKQEIQIPSPNVKAPNDTFTIKTEGLKNRNAYKSVKLRLDPTSNNTLEIHVTHTDEVQDERPHLAMVSEAVGIKNYHGSVHNKITEEVEYTVDLTELFN